MKITLAEIKLLVEQAKDELNKECPASTQDVSLNTANRDRAIQADFITSASDRLLLSFIIYLLIFLF